MIRKFLLSALMLLAGASPALAEITFSIEEPAEGSTRSGIGLVSGWAVSDLGIVSVEVFMDGESMGFVPHGSVRGDVADAFPFIEEAVFSGWGMKWAYSLTGEGEHTMRIVVTEEGGGTASKEVTFNVTRFNSEFIGDPADVRTAGATIESPVDGRLIIRDAEIENEIVDIELAWDTGSQQFLIDRVLYSGETKTKQYPTVQAGSNLSVETGSRVSISGEGVDPDGYISTHLWTQVSGPAVNLENPDQWTVTFTAPEQAGTIKLRLEVSDDDGLTSSDDVSIEVYEPEPPNQAPQAEVGNDFTVRIGDPVSIKGTASDSDGSVVAWRWTVVGGDALTLVNATSSTVSFTAPATEGYSRLRLRVTDDDGAYGYDYVNVTYEDPTPVNQAPTANAGSDRTVDGGDSVTVTGSGSDPDGSIVNWSWRQVSGVAVNLSGANSQSVAFTAPDSATTIRLELTVTDDAGASDSDEVAITVKAAPSGTTSGDTVFSMLDDLNAARAVTRTCGDTEYAAQPALQWSGSLAEIAMIHSMDMAARAYFAHDTLDGPTFSERVWPYWNGRTIGENIAASSHDKDDQGVIEMWLNSPGHCALIMNPSFTHAGIGVGHDPDNDYPYHYFWTLDFGG